MLRRLSLTGLAASALGLSGTHVRFLVTDAFGTPQNCKVRSFRSLYLGDAADELAPLFLGCVASIPAGEYHYDLGKRRHGRLVVNGEQVLKIIEDSDDLPGLAVEMPHPTPISGRLIWSYAAERESLRVRLTSLWGTISADSDVGPDGRFHFAAVAHGSYLLFLVNGGKVVWSTPILKSHRALEKLELVVPPGAK